METVEPFGAFDDEWQLETPSHSVTLKDGIDLREVSRGEGAVFELDSSVPPLDSVGGDSAFDQKDVYNQLNYECTGMGGSGSESEGEGMAPFERMAMGMQDLTEGTGGVLKRVLRPGVGVVVPEGAMVRVHYNGYLEYSDEPYDSSRLRNRQQQFRLGKGEVIPCWDIAVATMRRTELARFLVKPEYAFGSMGCPPRIPPDATIMFEIELVSFVDHRAADEFSAFSKKERESATLDQMIAVANAEREAGNDFFHQRNFGRAAGKYNRAVHLLEGCRLKNAEEEEQWKAVLLKLYLNLSLCDLKQCKSKLAISHCRRGLELDAKNVKAHFRLGQAHLQLSEFKKSREYLTKAAKLSPGNEEVRQELQKLDRAVKKFQTVEKTMYSKMFQTSPASKPEKSASDELLEETRVFLLERLSAFKQNHDMTELVLPANLEAKELKCAEEVAKELGLKTEKRPQYGIKITKPLEVDIPPFS